jgi:hypothetical protein
VALALCTLLLAEDSRACDCTHAETACLTDIQMARHAVHIAMLPDLMGDHINVKGIAVFEVTFGRDGKVIHAKAVSGHPIAINLLLGAAPEWQFRPFVQDGTARRACGRLTVRFSMVESKASVVVLQPGMVAICTDVGVHCAKAAEQAREGPR